MSSPQSNVGVVYINTDGLYLVYTTRTTHTGVHHDMDFTHDMNRATVFYGRVPANAMQVIRHHGCQTLRAQESRTVRLVPVDDNMQSEG